MRTFALALLTTALATGGCGQSAAPLRPASSTAPAGRIVALGDSITHGYPDPARGWATALGIDDAGVSGDRTDQMLRRLPAVLATRPRLVLVMGGTNDLIQGVPQSTIIANLTTMVDEVRAGGAEPVLLTIAPRSERSWVAPTDALNARIRDLARSEDIRLVDVHAVLAGPDGTFVDGYTDDGIHPTPTGYAAIAALVFRAILSHSSGLLWREGVDASPPRA